MNLPRISDALTMGTMIALTLISLFMVLTFEPAVAPEPEVPVQLAPVQVQAQKDPTPKLPPVTIQR
ncbi:hypothetical protein [Inhella gelatinilytica]|uniref:Uncharacterized protein n=1 Tax=Inhella gelatinilytica TaxID=2795030 RepID=A0A931ND69_9BURK|nr:hypothetical protein [Inhella gelatinilytica]MBH9552289.1 hypothetical protein [Inhella gelatinilytica]